MPKAKPSLQGGVIIHRIEFQEKERDILEMYALSKSINNILWPVVTAGSAIGGFWLVNEIYGQGTAFWDKAKDTMFMQAIEAGLRPFTKKRNDK
jgi:hypothetical protein